MFNWLFMMWIFLAGWFPFAFLVFRYTPVEKGKKSDWSVDIFGSLVAGLVISLIVAFSLTCLIAGIRVWING